MPVSLLMFIDDGVLYDHFAFILHPFRRCWVLHVAEGLWREWQGRTSRERRATNRNRAGIAVRIVQSSTCGDSGAKTLGEATWNVAA